MNPPVSIPSGNPAPPPQAAANNDRQWPAGRLMSMDVYRGFVMTLMVAEVLRFGDLHETLPNSAQCGSF